MGGTPNMLNAFAGTHDHRRSRLSDKSGSSGIFGSAAGLIDNILTSRQTPKKVKPQDYDRTDSRRPRSSYFEDHLEGDVNSSEGYRDSDSAQKRRSVFLRLKEKIQPSTSRSTGSTTRSHSRECDKQPSPPSRGRDPKPRSNPTNADRPSRPHSAYALAADVYNDEHFPLRSHPVGDTGLERMLESAVEHHRRQVLNCRKQLEHATRHPDTTLDDLQDLLDDMRDHDDALENALRTLNRARNNYTANRHSAMPDFAPPRPVKPVHEDRHDYFEHRSVRPTEDDGQNYSSHQPGKPTQNCQYYSNHRSTKPTQEDGHDYFNHFDYVESASHKQEPQSHPIFAEFTGMHGMDPFAQSLFVQQEGRFSERSAHASTGECAAGYNIEGQRHSIPSNKSERYFSNSTSHPRPATGAPKYPPTVLTSDEAWRLFQKYNNRWNTLAPDDPRVPFPTRGLHAEALTGRDTLWAPDVGLHPANWSEEVVMQANAQAFFLGVVGLPPRYTPAPGRGRIEMGFDGRDASPEQIKALIDILKKEKMRWHSDRLGRRNDGRSSMNTSLQQDPRARAVFHATCELMSLAQEHL